MQTAINNSSSPRHLGYGNIIFLGFIFKFQLLFHTIRIIFISNFELYVPRVFAYCSAFHVERCDHGWLGQLKRCRQQVACIRLITDLYFNLYLLSSPLEAMIS